MNYMVETGVYKFDELIQKIRDEISWHEYEMNWKEKKLQSLIQHKDSFEKKKYISFSKGLFIKLGVNGEWENSSLSENKIRIGWSNLTLEQLNRNNSEELHIENAKSISNKGAATRDTNALINILNADESTVFITFAKGCLYWTTKNGRELVKEDSISKYITCDGWSSNHAGEDTSIVGLRISDIPGEISKIQRFSGTCCEISEINILNNIINNIPCEEGVDLRIGKEVIINSIEKSLKHLHWKDFELLIGLIFQKSGWDRVSALGENAQGIDIELLDRINNERYAVQIKVKSGISDVVLFRDNFRNCGYRKRIFISIINDYASIDLSSRDEDLNLWGARDIAELVVKFGLVDWLINKIN